MKESIHIPSKIGSNFPSPHNAFITWYKIGLFAFLPFNNNYYYKPTFTHSIGFKNHKGSIYTSDILYSSNTIYDMPDCVMTTMA